MTRRSRVLGLIQGAALVIVGIAMAAPASQPFVALRVLGAAAVLAGLASIASIVVGSRYLERRPLLLIMGVSAVLGIDLAVRADSTVVRAAWFAYSFAAAVAAVVIAFRPQPDPQSVAHSFPR